jgi:hypothetical protein
VDGYDGRDPVLHSALTSFQHKADIITQIDVSADHLRLGRNHELVFHRTTVEDQAKVIHPEGECVRGIGHHWQLQVQDARTIKREKDKLREGVPRRHDERRGCGAAEGHKASTGRSGRHQQAVYRDGDDLLEQVRVSCFTLGQQGLLPKDAHKPVDGKTRLHARLAFPKMHCIPVGFYYAKWLEKMEFYLRTNTSRERSLTPSSIASSSAAAPSAERLALMEKRAAIFEDKADDDLTTKDKAVYKYRAERKRQWNSFSGSTTLSELQYNEQYGEEQLAGVKKSLASLNERKTPKQRQSCDGSTEQARR